MGATTTITTKAEANADLVICLSDDEIEHVPNVSGRVVVQKPPGDTIDVSVGSVIAAVNSRIIPHNTKFGNVMNMLKYAINHAPAVITFAHDTNFETFWLKVLKPGLG